VNYRIYKENQQLVGTAKTVHVTLDATTRQKIEIPKKFREILEKHLVA
jgi:1,4-dihydroxy-2-naphthoyl-CoA hydrolase